MQQKLIFDRKYRQTHKQAPHQSGDEFTRFTQFLWIIALLKGLLDLGYLYFLIQPFKLKLCRNPGLHRLQTR